MTDQREQWPRSRRQEMRMNWRFVAAASLGTGSGYLFISYMTNLFVPHLLGEFGWSRSSISLVGTTVLLPALCLPVVGRLTDMFGVRKVAAIGILGAPVIFFMLSAMTGSFVQFFVLMAAMAILVGSTTTSLVYSRLIAEQFDLSRGLAIGISASAPATFGALVAPPLASFMAEHGWRAGYLAMAGWTAIGGVLALLMIPAAPARQGYKNAALAKTPFRLPDYRALLGNRSFQIITIGMLLCNFPTTMNGTQLKVLLLDRALSDGTASWMISIYALGIVVGRLLCGLALDRYPPHIVVAAALSLPAMSLFILASGVHVPILLGLAVSVLGLALGAEADIIAFLVMRFFQVEIFGTVLGVVAAIATVSAALGAVLLSLTLNLTGNFTLFLTVSALATATGAATFLLLGHTSPLGSAKEDLCYPR